MNDIVLRKLREWRASPLLFVKECIRANPTDQQAEFLYNFTKEGTSHKTSIRSGHGVGKDACASWIILWFQTTRLSSNPVTATPLYPKVVCTAPTAHQLADILWSELSKWLRQSLVADEFVIQKDKMFHKDSPKEWWVRAVAISARASKEEQAEAFAGFHGDHLLILVDEASGMPDPIFITAEGALTQEDNHLLLIGNMTKNAGYFYDSQFHPVISKMFNKYHWDSRKSSNVKSSYVDYMKSKYGELSNVFRIRVAGDPPLEDEKTFIPIHTAIQCIGNDIAVPENEPLYLGGDVARYGDDCSIGLPRRGNLVLPWDEYHSMNVITLAGHFQQSYVDNDAVGMAIDEIGVGAGVVDWLLKRNLPGIFGVNVANSSSDLAQYNRLRDELWWRVREKCAKGSYSFPDIMRPGSEVSLGNELANELATPTYDFNAHGGFIIESKKDMKSRGKASPNIADALCLSEYFSDVATKVWAPKRFKKKKIRSWRGFGGRPAIGNPSHAWMTN